MSARDEILSAIRLRRVRNEPRPSPYHPAAIDGDPVAQFAKRATSQAAEVRHLSSMDDVPAAVADILRGRNMQAVIHLPPGSADEQLPWQSAPGLTRGSSPPGPDDAALALAPYAIDWENRSIAAFLAGYRETIAGCASYPADPAQAQRLLEFFILEKAFYEMSYELANRPAWVRIPLDGIRSILQADRAGAAGGR